MDCNAIVCYNFNMSNTLIIGKDLPSALDFAQALASTGRKIFAIARNQTEEASFESENIFTSTWNKSSAVSAHSTLIKAETRLETLDEVVFYFDTEYFCSSYELDKTEDLSNAVDTMINAFLYSSTELLHRIDQKKEKIFVSFLLKEYPSKAEAALSKTPGISPASAVVSAAQQAFSSIAESFASNAAGRPYLWVTLAKCNRQNELYANETELAKWLASAFDTVKQPKNPQNVKQALTWNKAGSKIQTGFTLFK